MINALAAPLIFNGIVEYPLMLVLAGWLNPGEENVLTNLPARLEWPCSRSDLTAAALVGLVTAGLVFVVGVLLPADRLTAALMFFSAGHSLFARRRPAGSFRSLFGRAAAGQHSLWRRQWHAHPADSQFLRRAPGDRSSLQE